MMRNGYAMVDAKSLRPSGYNPNMLSDDQRAQLVDEIKRQGKLLKPVVCRDDDGQLVIIDGEHTWQAALEARLAEVPVEVVEVDGFEARRQTFIRNLSGAWHKVRLGWMFAQMLAERSRLSNRDLAAELGCSEGTVRNVLLYARAADLCAGRDDCPDEDVIAAMGVRQVRELIARLEGLADEGEQQQDQPGAAEPEARILVRLKRAWNKATPDERKEFIDWTGVQADVEVLKRACYKLGYFEALDGLPNRYADSMPEPVAAAPEPEPGSEPLTPAQREALVTAADKGGALSGGHYRGGGAYRRMCERLAARGLLTKRRPHRITPAGLEALGRAPEPDKANGEEPRNDYAQRGARIRAARQERGLTAKALAQLAGLSSPNLVSMAELARLTKSGGPAAGRPTYTKLEAVLRLTP